MKTLNKLLFAVTFVAVIVGCSMAPPAGTITFTIPASYIDPQGSVEGARGTGVATTVRIWMESRNQPKPLGTTTAYYEQAIPDTRTVTLEGIVPATQCVVFLSLGEGTGSGFTPLRYAASSAFDVIAGSTAYVLMTPATSPFEKLASYVDPEGVRSLDTDYGLYFLAEDTLYRYGEPEPLLTIAGANSLDAGKVIVPDVQALGAFRIWINAADGIHVYDPALRVSEGVLAGTDGYNIVESGIVRVQMDGTPYDIPYYQRPGSAGGAYFNQGAWEWVDAIGYLRDNPNMADLYNLIKDATSRLIADLELHYDVDGNISYGYAVVPILNTFRIPASIANLFGDGAEPIPDPVTFDWIKRTFLQPSYLVDVPLVEGIKPLIKSISEAGGYVYIGTNQGIFVGTTGTEGAINEGSLTYVTLPRKVEIARVRATEYEGFTWAAALTRKGAVEILRNGQFLTGYRFHTGVPEAEDGLAEKTGELYWTADGLVVAGTNGVVRMGWDKILALAPAD